MSEPENLMLVMLRRIDANVSDLRQDVHEIKIRLGTLEEGYASASRRLDRLDGRVERIERRLDINDAA